MERVQCTFVRVFKTSMNKLFLFSILADDLRAKCRELHAFSRITFPHDYLFGAPRDDGSRKRPDLLRHVRGGHGNPNSSRTSSNCRITDRWNEKTAFEKGLRQTQGLLLVANHYRKDGTGWLLALARPSCEIFCQEENVVPKPGAQDISLSRAKNLQRR
jgi:hypothetical protein